MTAQTKTRAFLFFAACGLCLTIVANASAASGTTPVEHESQWWPKSQGGSLSTIYYRPSKREQPFFDRLPTDGIVTGSDSSDYDIATKEGEYVGWFGIVREINEDTDVNRTVLTVEHKYFDGLTDAYLQAVSFNGSGDFRATLTGTGHRIPPLSLVKVYGTVFKGKDCRLPEIDSVFVRDWHWGTFTFLAAYGTQRGSERWRKANQIPLDDIYEASPHPCHHYYEERLGKRPDAQEIREHLLEAAGPLSEEASQAMERLASLLALGHTWSPAETGRQARELSEIRKLVEMTGSQKAVIRLLIQAIRENDERVSWSASGKLAAFDPAGDAIADLVKLLGHEHPRVRAGAAHALSSGYGVKAAPAVAALERCVDETYPDLKEYALLALGDIGPSAKQAVPKLKNALADENLDSRIQVAKALWLINRQPVDVIPMLVTVLENGNASERCAAAEQFKEMGPWAALAVPALIKALKDVEWVNRCNVAEALGEVGPRAAAAVPALMEVLQSDENTLVQSCAAEALGKIDDPKAIPALITALENEDDSVQLSAVDALEASGHKANAAVPALIRVVNDNGANGWLAAKALGAIDAEGVSTPTLIKAIGNKSPQMRRFAAYGLNHLGRKAAMAAEALHDGLQDRDPGARIACALAYWSVTGKAEETVSVLRSAIQTTDHWAERMWAADALAEIGPAADGAVPDLIACLKSNAQHVVTSSAKALGEIGPSAASAVPVLTAQLKDSDNNCTRVCIAWALWRINHSEQSLPVLEDTLANSRDFMALSQAAEAIGEMGPQARGLAPLLEPLLKDSDSFVREAAAKAIKQVDRE